MGFDNNQPGRWRNRRRRSLPIWIHYMAQGALGHARSGCPVPSGIVERAGRALKGGAGLLRGNSRTPIPDLGLNNRSSDPQANEDTAAPAAGRTTPGPDAPRQRRRLPRPRLANPAARCGGQGKGAVVLMPAPGRACGSPLTALALIQTRQVCWISADMHQIPGADKTSSSEGRSSPKSYVAMQPGPL